MERARAGVLVAMVTALGGCNAIFDIGSPTRADAASSGSGSGAAPTSSSSGTGGAGGGAVPPGMALVPAGSFEFGKPSGAQTTATLTRSFWVDELEVTVARFQAWVDAGQPAPCDGGSCTLDPGGPYEATMLWEPTWNSEVASTAYGDSGECTVAMNFQNPPLTWTTRVADHPINCVTWFHAAALCAFEGKRLMTETEWEYLAGYGHPTADYPWGTETPTCDHALWNLDMDAMNPCQFPKPVGSTPQGISQLGLWDLGGSLFEWTWDWHNDYPTEPVTDYTGATEPNAGSGMSRVTRGGSWAAAGGFLDVHQRDFTYVTGTYGDIGIRCAQSGD